MLSNYQILRPRCQDISWGVWWWSNSVRYRSVGYEHSSRERPDSSDFL